MQRQQNTAAVAPRFCRPVYRRGDGTGAYELYVGRLSTNECWPLTSASSYPNRNVTGATFSPATPTLASPWSLGGPNYQNYGGGRPPGW